MSPSTSNVLLSVVAPSTSNVLLSVVAPSTSNVLLSVVAPSTSNFASKSTSSVARRVPVISKSLSGRLFLIPTLVILWIEALAPVPVYPHKS